MRDTSIIGHDFITSENLLFSNSGADRDPCGRKESCSPFEKAFKLKMAKRIPSLPKCCQMIRSYVCLAIISEPQ